MLPVLFAFLILFSCMTETEDLLLPKKTVRYRPAVPMYGTGTVHGTMPQNQIKTELRKAL